jgi:hypothetical protein
MSFIVQSNSKNDSGNKFIIFFIIFRITRFYRYSQRISIGSLPNCFLKQFEK